MKIEDFNENDELKIGAKVKFGSSNRLEEEKKREEESNAAILRSRRACCHSSLCSIGGTYGGGARLDIWMKKYMRVARYQY